MNWLQHFQWKANFSSASCRVGLMLSLAAGGLFTESAWGQSNASGGYRNSSASVRRASLNWNDEREQSSDRDSQGRIATKAQASYYYDGTDEAASHSPSEITRKPVAEEARRTPTPRTRTAPRESAAPSAVSRKNFSDNHDEEFPADRSNGPTSVKRNSSPVSVKVSGPVQEDDYENEKELDRPAPKTSSRRSSNEGNAKGRGIRLVSASEPIPTNEVVFEEEPPLGAPLKGPMWKAAQGNGDANATQPPPARIVPDALTSAPFETIEQTGEWQVVLRRSKLLRTSMNILRTAVVDPTICDIVQFTPQEVSIIGRARGATQVTFWFEGEKQRPMTYLVRVVPDPERQRQTEQAYKLFEDVLTELFPDSKVRLVPVADKLIVKGQCKDGEEAAQIMALIRGESGNVGGSRARGFGNNRNYGFGGNFGGNTGGANEGPAADPIPGQESASRLPASQIVNMLRIPGVQQVALRVKIAELNRTAARQFGADLDMNIDVGNGSLLLQSMLNAASGGTGSILGQFNGDKINFGIHFLETYGVVRVLSEPTLVTMSGRPASFVAGGEFAVPTTVGVNGVGAVTTDFRAFGAIINFLPTVLDKDRIRLEVSPEFSKINSDLTSNGTPGLDTRSVTTTVEMREGQTFAIAGLLDDGMKYDQSVTYPIPILRDIFGKRNGSRNETELMILVTPELVHPMDPEEVPPLPGFDVTEPTHTEFYIQGKIEGRPTRETRTTVWPRLRHRYQGTSGVMISGPFGHGQ